LVEALETYRQKLEEIERAPTAAMEKVKGLIE